jgi:hypothetical protein
MAIDVSAINEAQQSTRSAKVAGRLNPFNNYTYTPPPQSPYLSQDVVEFRHSENSRTARKEGLKDKVMRFIGASGGTKKF